MAQRRPPMIHLRRTTIVRVAIVAAVLAALAVGVAVGITLGRKSSPSATKSIDVRSSTTTSYGSTTDTTVAPTTTTTLPVVLSCGPGSTPHRYPTRLTVGCATGRITVTGVTWHLWDAATGGQGTGTLNVMNADGTVGSAQAIVVVFGAKSGIFQNVSIVPMTSLTTTTTTTPTATPTASPTTTPTTGGPSPVLASQPGTGWGSG